MLKGYQFDIWRAIYHNGVFSHNSTRYETVHATNENEAREMLELKPECSFTHPGLRVDGSEEYIYSVRYLGRVTYETRVVYKKEETNG